MRLHASLIALAALPLAVGCFPDPITETDETPPDATFGATPTPGEALDLTGRWAMKTVMTQWVENAFDSTVYDLQTVVSYFEVDLAAGSSDTELRYESQICLTELSEVSGSIATIHEGFYPATVPVPYTVTLSEAAIGATFTLPEFVELRAVDMDPTDALPVAADSETDCDDVDSDYMSSEGVFDYDGDGNPGFTIAVDGAVNADLWTIERLRQSFSGTVYAQERIQGGIEGLLEDHFICSTRPGLVTTDVDVYPEEGEEANFFVLVKVEEGTSCSEIVSEKESLFE